MAGLEQGNFADLDGLLELVAMRRICSIPTCNRHVYARDWCRTHYRRWHTHGSPQADVPVKTQVKSKAGNRPICERDGCDRRIHAKGLCKQHYTAVRNRLRAERRRLLRQQRRCKEQGCEGPYYARGRCRPHYQRQYYKVTHNPKINLKSAQHRAHPLLDMPDPNWPPPPPRKGCIHV